MHKYCYDRLCNIEKMKYFYIQDIVVCDFYALYIVCFKMPQERLFCVFGYNYRMSDKVTRIGKYGFTRVYYCDKMV